MSDLRELYQEVIMDHNKKPRNFHKLENANRVADGRNPLCGDHYTVYLLVENGIVTDIGFDGSGCAISKASASIMSSEIKGKSVEEADRLFRLFHDIVTGKLSGDEAMLEAGKLGAFAGVAEFPVRVKCATLAWHAMQSGLHSGESEISTEEHKH